MTQFNIMMVHAHPADFACDASGTAALHVEKGDNVTSVVVSYGDRHHMQWLYDQEKKPEKERDPDFANLDAEMYRDFKKRETERIAEILGVELVLLEWTDWAELILVEPYKIEKGHIVIPEVPGTGIEFKKEVLD